MSGIPSKQLAKKKPEKIQRFIKQAGRNLLSKALVFIAGNTPRTESARIRASAQTRAP